MGPGAPEVAVSRWRRYGRRWELNPIKLNHYFQKYALAPTRNNLRHLIRDQPIWSAASHLTELQSADTVLQHLFAFLVPSGDSSC